jgi:hypothetical protein
MKINHPLVKGTVQEIIPKVFCVFVEDSYQRSMLFCRYQEFYESPFKEIRNKFFTWEDYMMIYKTKNKRELFTYPTDWSGYNIPSKVISKALSTFDRDKGSYDEIMNSIWYYCENYPLKFDKPRTKWYLIGTNKKDIQTMNHEIAHGLYYTDKNYRKSCEKLLSRIKGKDYSFLKKSLIKMGYADDDEILDDEIQAFMSTGLHGILKTDSTQKYTKEFTENFKTFYK